MAHFDFTDIRDTAMGLVKDFGRTAVCTILRHTEGTLADATKPWRGGNTPGLLQFQFQGTVSTLGFPKRSDPITDGDIDVIAPGDLATTAALSDPMILCGDPQKTDRIMTDAGKEYAILGVQDVTPDDKTIIYKIRCRAWPLITQQQSTPF